MKKWLVVLVLSLAVFSAGCHKKTVVTNLPVGVQSSTVMNWYTATGITDTTAKTANQLTDSLIQLNRQGIFSDGPAYTATLTSVGKIARAGKKADDKLRTMPQDFTKAQKDVLLEFSQEIAVELQNAETQSALGIKNKNSQAAVSNLLKTIQNGLALAQALTQ